MRSKTSWRTAAGSRRCFRKPASLASAVVSANQFLDQYPAEMRAAILCRRHPCVLPAFEHGRRTSSQALDGGKSLAERLKNLPQRHCIVKSGSDRWTEVEVPTVREPKVDYTDLLNRSRIREDVCGPIERDIAKRQEGITHSTDEVLHDWE